MATPNRAGNIVTQYRRGDLSPSLLSSLARSNPGFKAVMSGSGKLVLKNMKGVPSPPGSTTKPPATPAPPPNPYSLYPKWAQRDLQQRDSDIANTQSYGSSIQQWLSGQLAPIQAGSQAAVQNYRNSMAALPIPGPVGLPAVQGAGGGTIAGSPDTWKRDAAATQAKGYGVADQGQAAIQSFLSDAGMGNLRSQLEANLAGQLLQIPEAQKKEKREYITKLDQFLEAQKAEDLQFQQKLAQDTTNDWYDFVGMLTNAGVKLEDIAADSTRGTGGVVVNSAKRPTTPGYNWYEESPGRWRGIQIPGAGSAGSSGGKPTGLIGPIDNPNQKPPPGYVKVKSGGKTYWRAKGGTTGGSGGGGGLSAEQIRIQRNEARDFWRGDKGSNAAGQTVYSGGLNKSAVSGYTDANGNLLPGKSSEYVTVIRIHKLREQIEAGLTPAEARRLGPQLIAGVVGTRNYTNYVRWASKASNINVARRRKHI